MGQQQVQSGYLSYLLQVAQVLVHDAGGVLAQPAAVRPILTAQERLPEAAEAKQVGSRLRVEPAAAFPQGKRMQAVVVVAALQGVAALAVVVEP